MNVYDYDERCHITGYGNNEFLILYHYGNSHHINLKLMEILLLDMIMVRVVILAEKLMEMQSQYMIMEIVHIIITHYKINLA